jgi:hypothetical protein
VDGVDDAERHGAPLMGTRLAVGITAPTPRLRGKRWYAQHAAWLYALASEAVALDREQRTTRVDLVWPVNLIEVVAR